MPPLHTQGSITLKGGASHTPLVPPKRALSLRARNSLIEERVGVIGIARAQCVACEISVELPKDICKKRGRMGHGA